MRILFVFIFAVIYTISCFSQEQMNLNKAIQIALHKNSDLKKSINSLESFESNVQAAYGNFLPSLGAGARWDWSRSDVEGEGTIIIGGVSIPTTATTSTTRNYQASISSDWVLFNGLSNLATLSQSENDLQSAELTLQRIKQDIVFQTTSLYYDIINRQKQLKVNEDNLKWNEKNLETIRERNKLGAATLADVYQQEVATGNSELEIIITQNNLENAKNDLLYFLGVDVLEQYIFSDSLTAEENEILNVDLLADYQNITELVNEALENRHDYKSAKLNFESASDGVTIAQSGHWPSLIADGSYLWRGDNISTLDQSKTFSAGLSLRIPIFEGWSVSNRVQFAEVEAKNSEIVLSDLERDIKRQIQNTYLNLQAVRKGLLVSQRNVAAANESLKIEEEKYAIGAGKLLDVLIVNSNYTNAMSDLINAQFAYIVSSARLKYYLGVLDFTKYE